MVGSYDRLSEGSSSFARNQISKLFRSEDSSKKAYITNTLRLRPLHVKVASFLDVKDVANFEQTSKTFNCKNVLLKDWINAIGTYNPKVVDRFFARQEETESKLQNAAKAVLQPQQSGTFSREMQLLKSVASSLRKLSLVNEKLHYPYPYLGPYYTQAQFLQVIENKFPMLQELHLEIPRPAMNSLGVDQPNIIDKAHLDSFAKNCPNVTKLALHKLSKSEIFTLLGQRETLSSSDGDQKESNQHSTRLPQNLTHLSLIYCSTNVFEDVEGFSRLLRSIKTLESVSVEGNFSSNLSLLPRIFCDIPKLKSLKIYDGRVGYKSVAQMTSLEELHRFCTNDLEGLKAVSTLPKLRVLSLNWHSKFEPVAILAKTTPQTLEELRFSFWYRNIEDSLLSCPKMTVLKKVVIEGTTGGMTNASLQALSRCAQLSELHLNFDCTSSFAPVTIDDRGLLALKDAPALKGIVLPKNFFTTQGVINLVIQSRSLQWVDVSKAPHLSAEQIEQAAKQAGKKFCVKYG